LLAVYCLLLTAYGSLTAAHAQVVVDKTIATVTNGSRQTPDLITYSDLIWQLALQPNTPLEQPSSEQLNGALRTLEDQHLVLLEAEKLPTTPPSADEVRKLQNELARHFASPAEMRQRMARVGLTTEQLNDILRDRVAMEHYLDFRFRAFVLIKPQDITDYYNEKFVPPLRARGNIVPPLDQVRSQIEHTLTEEKIGSEIDKFIEGLRDRAEVVILNPV
jgi:hypothetical protein